jgi:hypothetical protein
MSFVRSQRVRRILVTLSTALALSLAAGCMTDDDLVDPELFDDVYLDDGKGSGLVDKDEWACDPGADHCRPGETSPQTFPSPRRVDRVVGNLRVTSGRVRMRIYSTHAGDDTLLFSGVLGVEQAGSGFAFNKKVPTAVDRHMRVIIDEVSVGTSYDLWLDFRG